MSSEDWGKKASYNKCMKMENDGKSSSSLCKRGKCTAKVKYEVYPSAYANGFAVQVCKGEQPDALGNKRETYDKRKKKEKRKDGGRGDKDGGLKNWFEEEWIDVCATMEQNKKVPCGRKSSSSSDRDYPYCRPSKRTDSTTVKKTFDEMNKAEKKKMCRKKENVESSSSKKSDDKNTDRARPPNRVFVE